MGHLEFVDAVQQGMERDSRFPLRGNYQKATTSDFYITQRENGEVVIRITPTSRTDRAKLAEAIQRFIEDGTPLVLGNI